MVGSSSFSSLSGILSTIECVVWATCRSARRRSRGPQRRGARESKLSMRSSVKNASKFATAFRNHVDMRTTKSGSGKARPDDWTRRRAKR
eukprot:448438-Prymnesium_polylepis.1